MRHVSENEMRFHSDEQNCVAAGADVINECLNLG